MLKLQAADVDDPVLKRHLEEAAYRVSAVAKAHERIHQGDGTDRLDLGTYIQQVCRNLNEVVSHCTIKIEAEHGIDLVPDRAVPIALIGGSVRENRLVSAPAAATWASAAQIRGEDRRPCPRPLEVQRSRSTIQSLLPNPTLNATCLDERRA
jgi:hypothetical protein